MNVLQVILFSYLAVVTGIGVYSFFRVRTAADYYVSGKRGGWLQITGSLFATIMGGSAILGTVELSQKAGWPAAWFLLSAAAGLVVLSFISSRVSYLGHYTLPELLLRFYGKKAEMAASILIPIAWTGIVAAQIIAGAKIISSLQLTSYDQGALICGIIFIFYTIAGGQLSILKTDFAQALIILAGIFTMLALRLLRTEGTEAGLPVPVELFNDRFSLADLIFLLLTYSVTFVVGPDIYSRIFCARSPQVARKSVITTAILLVPVAFALTYLGVAAAHPSEPPNGFILPGTGFLPVWALGLIAAALLSAVMSSADTTLLTSSMILSELITGNLDKPISFRLTRVFIIVMGAVSLAIALHVTSILNALLISLSFFSGAFVIPIIAGLAGWRVNRKNALYAILAGGILSLSGKLVNEITGQDTGYWLIAAGFAVNYIILKFQGRQVEKRTE